VKTPARFHTDLFCSLFRALRPLGSEKIANNFAPRDCLQKFAGFSRGLGRNRPTDWVSNLLHRNGGAPSHIDATPALARRTFNQPGQPSDTLRKRLRLRRTMFKNGAQKAGREAQALVSRPDEIGRRKLLAVDERENGSLDHGP
jgi:hypothetical protein